MAFPDLDPNHVFRDFTTLGVPASGKWDPRKVEIRRLLKSHESAIIALIGGQGGDIDLVRGVMYFSVTGGTANDIIAEPDAELPENPGSTVYIIGGIAQDNTSPVTINGKPLLTNSGNEIAAGGIVGGGIYLFLDVGANYRLLSDQASAAIVAAAEAAAIEAIDAADRAEAAAAGVEYPVSYAPQSLLPEEQAQARENIGILPPGDVDSVSAAELTNIPAGVTFIRTAGFAVSGDGGAALYKRALSEPTHAGKFQSADGAWWELSESVINPMMLGARADGAIDDTAAVRAALALGRPVDWGGASRTYRVTDTITQIPPQDVYWASSGATILLDSANPVQFAISMNCAGRNVTIVGSLLLNCQDKAFVGWYFQNSSTTTFGDFYASNLKVQNVFRGSSAFTGGDGIWIRGGWRNVYLERPDVRNVRMAIGAGVQGAQGVTGITVNAMTLAPQEVTVIAPYIENVYSLDASYLFDQDGMRVFAAEDDGTAVLTPSHFSLVGGKIRNCGGRGVKSQMEFGHIVGTHFERNASGHGSIARTGNMPEIDFQTGGGLIENIECKYNGSAPHRIVQLTGSRQASPIRIQAGAKVDGIRISRTGANQISSLVHIAPAFMRGGVIDIRNINHADSGNLIEEAILFNNEAANNSIYVVNIENVLTRVDAANSKVFVRCTRTVGTTHFVGRNIVVSQANTDFLLSGTGTTTEKLEGTNVNVV
ncbi:hypothetical protein ACVCNR_15010 [Aquamicrobium terrae]